MGWMCDESGTPEIRTECEREMLDYMQLKTGKVMTGLYEDES